MATKKPKVLFVGAELWPYANAGGLSRVLYNLPSALLKKGIDARGFIPKYGKIDQTKYELEYVLTNLKVPTGGEDEKSLICNILTHKYEDGPITYFLENREYYELRANEYGYSDDHTRWGLLQRGLCEFLTQSDWVPDIIHCNDWQTGLVANMLKQYYKNNDKLKNIKVVFTMHSLRYQAGYDHAFVTELDMDDGKRPLPSILSQDFFKLNSLKRGIIYADQVTTVSPTYAREILTKEFGEGLDRLLNEVKDKLVGILNGINYTDFNSEKDSRIQTQFKNGDWKKRAENKAHLQEKFNIEVDPLKPTFLIAYRLAEQKGLDLIKDTMETIISEFGAQLIVKGDGDASYKSFFTYLAEKYPRNVALKFDFEDQSLTQLFAGSDILLHPSRFEPCGIVHLEAMRYGCIPLVRKVGGLADTVGDEENGIVFSKYDSKSLLIAMARACELYKHPKLFNSIRGEAMSSNFSWTESAKSYLKVYTSLLAK